MIGKYTLLFLALAIIAVSLLSTACDMKGSLDGKETEMLYSEIKNAFTTGEIWNYQPKAQREVNTIDKPVNESDIEFIKSLSESVFDESNQRKKYGLWTGSKTAIRTLVIVCSVTMPYDGKNCTVEEFSVTINESGDYIVNAYYRIDEASTGGRQRLLIRFEPS